MKRAIRAVLILIAAGLLVFGGMEIGLELVRHRLQQAAINGWHCGLGAILVFGGLLLLATSNRLARKLSDDFDD